LPPWHNVCFFPPIKHTPFRPSSTPNGRQRPAYRISTPSFLHPSPPRKHAALQTPAAALLPSLPRQTNPCLTNPGGSWGPAGCACFSPSPLRSVSFSHTNTPNPPPPPAAAARPARLAKATKRQQSRSAAFLISFYPEKAAAGTGPLLILDPHPHAKASRHRRNTVFFAPPARYPKPPPKRMARGAAPLPFYLPVPSSPKTARFAISCPRLSSPFFSLFQSVRVRQRRNAGVHFWERKKLCPLSRRLFLRARGARACGCARHTQKCPVRAPSPLGVTQKQHNATQRNCLAAEWAVFSTLSPPAPFATAPAQRLVYI
jgi:hypothetical protein